MSWPVRPSLRRHKRATSLVALFVSSAALATAEAQSVSETARAIAEQIQQEQSRNGPYSPELLEALMALVLLHEENGNTVLADGIIEQALQVVRANYGLYSIDQAPLLQTRIRHEEARGNFAAAWNLEQDLLDVTGRNRTDLKAVPVLREVATKRLEVLEAYIGGEYPPQIVLGCFYRPRSDRRSDPSGRGNCRSGTRSMVTQMVLSDAQRHYRAAIEALVQNGLYASAELKELEAAIIDSSYRHGSYWAGRQSLRRVVAYGTVTAEDWPPLQQLATQVADWDLLFGDYPLAFDVYERILHDLVTHNVAQEAIDALFAPPLPVVLPSFLPNPLASTPAAESSEYLDVAFEISRFGKSRRVKILTTSTHASGETRDDLTRLIERSRFRPQARNGRLEDTQVMLRYYPRGPVAAPAAPIDRDRPVGFLPQLAPRGLPGE